jgi:hypothetical protein
MSAPIDIKTGAALNHQRRLTSAPTSIQAAFFPGEEVKSFAPSVTLRESTVSDIYVGTMDALVAAGLMKAGQFPGQPGMRKVVVTIFADGTLPTGAPTAYQRRAREPGAMRVQRASKTTFSVSVSVPENVTESRMRAYRAAQAEYETGMRAIPQLQLLRPGAKGVSHLAPNASNVIDLRTARTARSAVSIEKDGERFLFDVTRAESYFLSYFYEHGHEKSALRLLKIAESGPDWDPNEGYLGIVYVTDGEVEFLRFMSRKGPVAAARELMNSINKPLRGEEASWGKVVSITPALRRAVPTPSLIPRGPA